MKYSTILIPVDGSNFSENAAQRGIELAKQLSASVTLLSVIDIHFIINSSAEGMIDPALYKICEEQAHEHVDSIAEKYPHEHIKKIVEEGIPAEVILKTADSVKANMIIMGTHGRKGLKHVLMGSVAEYVVRHSKVPVMVVPGKD